MRVAVAGGSGTVGRHVSAAALEHGHEVVVLSRSHGVDVFSGDGLAQALRGVEAVVDVTNPTERVGADQFFTAVAGRLQTIGAAQGVRHIVTLSIVGIDRATANPYYVAKLQQEHIALEGPVPATVIRATQFHEFAPQMLIRGTQGAVARIPTMRVQSVAARTVGEVLVQLASAAPDGLTVDLAGPEQADLVDLARAYVDHFGLDLTVEAAPSAIPYGATVPGQGARCEGPTFGQWLETPDAAALLVGRGRL